MIEKFAMAAVLLYFEGTGSIHFVILKEYLMDSKNQRNGHEGNELLTIWTAVR